jgi:Tat protein secretion system quality control protein TatD with DNase activity
VAVTLAQIKAVPPEEVAQATWRNTAHLFRLDA